MEFDRMITTIDTHTGGAPTRTVISGIGPIPGETMAAKAQYLETEADFLRTMLLNEPRGSRVMSAAILTEPCRPDADIGVVFAEVGGYLPMCGHDTIGCVTAIHAANLVPLRKTPDEIRLDTPAGLVVARIDRTLSGERIVGFRNAPAFVMHRGVDVATERGVIRVDVAYGGNVYVIASAQQSGISVSRHHVHDMIHHAAELLRGVNDQVTIRHPGLPCIHGATHVSFVEPIDRSGHTTGAVVIPPGEVDRSPCGTGISARLAVLKDRGLLEVGVSVHHVGVLGTAFDARIVELAVVGQQDAVVVEITGQAYVTGFHRFVAEPKDPLRDGFVLG